MDGPVRSLHERCDDKVNVNSINSLPKVPAGFKVDQITLEIVKFGLVMAAEQVNVRIIRSVMTIVIKEMEDCSAAAFDCDGRLLSDSASVPAHLNAIALCLRTIMEHHLPLRHIDMGSTWMSRHGWGVETGQEGIRFPPVKIVREGVVHEQLLSVLVNTTRVNKSLGDHLRAHISSIPLAKADIQKMFER